MIALRITLALVLLANVATAERAPSDERSAVDVAGAPRPGFESGLVEPADPGDSPARLIARGVLFVPRVAIDAAFVPVQLGVRAFERYQVVERWKRVFFNDAETMGLVPTLSIQSGFGATFGARFVHRDLFDRGARLSLRSSAGGRYRQVHRASFKTGELLGPRLGLEVDAEYERRPREPFYGIGNGDQTIEARYRHGIARATLVGDLRLVSALHARVSGALADHEITGGMSADAIDRRYIVEDLAGFGNTQRAYGELELRWDTRRSAERWEPTALISQGSLVAAFVGHSTALGSGIDVWRYGFDLQRFVRVAVGPRVLAFRAYAETVVGPRDDIPFFELPELGGKAHLRGYPTGRFRDRVAAVASVDYQWDLSRNFSANVFIDVGRAYPSLQAVTYEELRVGYGVGIQAHTEHSFLARASIASSIDGGVFLDFSLDPVFELDRRVER